MGGINIAQELTNNGRFNDDLVVEDENRYEATGVEGKEVCRTGPVHIDDSLLESNAYLGQTNVRAVGPWVRILASWYG